MSGPRPIGRIIRGNALADPSRPAVTCGAHSVSRDELERESNRLARAYEALGVGQDDLVTIALPNSVEHYVALCAIWKLGAVPQPVSSRLPAHERRQLLDLADPSLVVGVQPEDAGGRASVAPGFVPQPDLSDAALPDRVSPSWKAPTSGGSTGRPKLIVAGQSGDIDTDVGLDRRMQPDDVQLVPGPLYHNAPMMFSSLGLLLGAHLVVLPRFDADVALEAITRYRVTWMNTVPTMLIRMHRALEASPGRYDLSSLRAVWHMAASCPAWVKEAWIERIGGDRLWELYGGTEAQTATVIDGNDWLAHRGSVGRPINGGEVSVRDPFGEVLPVGEVGEVYLRRAPDAPPTYHYVGAEATSTPDGWETIGDLGRLDAEGYLYLSDRRVDLIVCGGANVYPAEVEGAIASHPLVRSSVVVGLPDDELGQTVHAVVQAEAGLTAEALLQHLADRLVRYKVPRSVEFVDEVLRDDAGKARRSSIRDAAAARRLSSAAAQPDD